MGIPSGLSAQLMTVDETAYGTPVTVDRGYEFIEESLELSIERLESSALRAGSRVLRSDRWAAGKRSVSGGIKMELANKSFGRWFKHCLGGVASAQPDSGGAPTVWKHTFTPGDIPVGQTIQVGKPDNTGTVQPHTYHGCKITQWTLECAIGQFATVNVSVLGEDEDNSTSLAVVSYPAGLALMTFVQGTLTVGGSALAVRSASVQGTNVVFEDRYSLGSALRGNPLEAGMRDFTGNIEPEYSGLTTYQRFLNGTEAELVLLFQGATISGAFKFETKVTANVRFDGKTPTVGGPQVLLNPSPWKTVDNSSNSLKIEYQTTDTAP